jgi:hypothetical protein
LVISPSRKLHVLTGEFVVTCDVLPEQLPSSLRHLTTPLPGQYNRSGDVVCPLYVSHREYLQQLAVRLPHLQSLTLVGERGCWAAEALQEFKHLRELRCKLWGLSGWVKVAAVEQAGWHECLADSCV